MKSFELHEALQNSYPSPNFVYLKEVRDATGFDAVRSADALAIGMYRSCGRLIHGFELKVSRSDWLRELKDAAKAESIMRYCHHWSVIVPDPKIVADGELPPSWGLGVPYRTRANSALKIQWVVKPPLLEPQKPNMIFLSALIYAAQKGDKKEAERAITLAKEAAFKQGQESTLSRIGNPGNLQTLVDAFEKSSGVNISKYDSEATIKTLGQDFKTWRKGIRNLEWQKKSLTRLKVQSKQVFDSLSEILDDQEDISE